ncbi:MAG: hypothetical protein HDS72_04560 [Bacteroidales bacterium]|nr:hypothetical protein [Bacteroidales bacterium]
MTEFDKQLIAKAENLRRWDYRLIDSILPFADTPEARAELTRIRWELYDLMQDSL